MQFGLGKVEANGTTPSRGWKTKPQAPANPELDAQRKRLSQRRVSQPRTPTTTATGRFVLNKIFKNQKMRNEWSHWNACALWVGCKGEQLPQNTVQGFTQLDHVTPIPVHSQEQ